VRVSWVVDSAAEGCGLDSRLDGFARRRMAQAAAAAAAAEAAACEQLLSAVRVCGRVHPSRPSLRVPPYVSSLTSLLLPSHSALVH